MVVNVIAISIIIIIGVTVNMMVNILFSVSLPGCPRHLDPTPSNLGVSLGLLTPKGLAQSRGTPIETPHHTPSSGDPLANPILLSLNPKFYINHPNFGKPPEELDGEDADSLADEDEVLGRQRDTAQSPGLGFRVAKF